MQQGKVYCGAILMAHAANQEHNFDSLFRINLEFELKDGVLGSMRVVLATFKLCWRAGLDTDHTPTSASEIRSPALYTSISLAERLAAGRVSSQAADWFCGTPNTRVGSASIDTSWPICSTIMVSSVDIEESSDYK